MIREAKLAFSRFGVTFKMIRRSLQD
jgi:hypothetical protein